MRKIIPGILALAAALALFSGCGAENTPAGENGSGNGTAAVESTAPASQPRVSVTPAEGWSAEEGSAALAHYRKGKREFDVILIKSSGPEAAALLLYSYKQKLTDPKVVAIFGGFSGKDGERPAFLFAKGPWLCGVLDLPDAEADPVARDLAARLN